MVVTVRKNSGTHSDLVAKNAAGGMPTGVYLWGYPFDDDAAATFRGFHAVQLS